MLFSLYVGHLPIKTTKGELMELFAAHNPTEAAVLRREDSQLFTFGFVRFDNPQAMVDAIREGDWTLHGAQLSVKIAKESRVALRQVAGGTHHTTKAVERDSLVRSRVKEACRVVNQDLDIINGDELLDAHWVLNHMESCSLKNTFKQTGSPDPSALLTYEALCWKIEHGPFTTGGAGVGQRRKEEVMEAMKTVLQGLHSRLLQTFAQSPHEAGVYPDRIPKDVMQLMTSVGVNDTCRQCCDEGGGSRCTAVLSSKSGADYEHATEEPDSGMVQQAAGPQSIRQKSSSQHHCPSVLLQSPGQARTGKGRFTTSHEQLRNPHRPRQPFSSDQAVPGGPPFSACGVEDSASQADPQGACSPSSGLKQEFSSKTPQVCTRQSDGLPARSSSSHAHTGVSAVHTNTNRLASRCFPDGGADLQNTVTDELSTPHTNNRSNSSQRDLVQRQSFSQPTEQPHRSFSKDFQHCTEGKKVQKLLKLLGQTGSVSEIGVSTRKTGDNDAPRHRIRNPHVLSSGNQSAQWSVEEEELTYVVPEEYKGTLESEDAAALQNQSNVWQHLGKANWRFLGKTSIEEEEPGVPAGSRPQRRGNQALLSHNPHVKDLHSPQRLHTAESPSAKLVSRTTEVESTLPDFTKTISSSQSDTTHSSEDKIVSSPASLRGRSSDSTSPGPGQHSPVPPPASPIGVGRGRGALYSMLLDSLQKRPGERGEDVKRGDSAPASSGQRASPTLVPGRGRGLKSLQLVKK